MRRIGKQTWKFDNVYVASSGTTVGPIESKGPLKDQFDKCYDNLYCGEKNWELAERKLLREAINICLEKIHKNMDDVDVLLAGDLLNQLITSNYVAREFNFPFLGMFSACATAMETTALGAVLIESNFAENVICATSSHNATAERQFRFPTEFGAQKPSSANFTVTGAGAVLLTNKPSSIKISAATIGKVIDRGMKDPLNMGSAMAPAAFDTIMTHLRETGNKFTDYDLIVTGDLSRIGSQILRNLFFEANIDVSNHYDDCGVMIFSADQKIFAGGSGCACPAVVTYGHIFKEILRGKLKKVFVVATGALLSPMMMQQKESIPCIAHGVVFERVDDD